MDLSLKFTDVPDADRSFQYLSACVAESQNLQQFCQSWFESGRSFACMRSDEASAHVVGFSFEENEEGIAVGMLPSDEAIKMTPGLEIVPASKDDAVLDAFVEKRNERLAIEFNEELQLFLSPARALQELLFSYALAEKGFGQATLVAHENGDLFIELFLVILTASGSPDWGETLHIAMDSVG